MKTTLSDEELIQLDYQYNIDNSYLFKLVNEYDAIFIDVKTRKIDCQCDEKYLKEIKEKENENKKFEIFFK